MKNTNFFLENFIDQRYRVLLYIKLIHYFFMSIFIADYYLFLIIYIDVKGV